MTKKHRQKVPLLRRLIVWSLVIIVSWTVILGFKATVAEPFEVPSGSMMPTLHVGDIVWVNKTVYGISWPWSRRSSTKQPARGDVIVFVHPISGEYYVKRVVGLPGEAVMVLGRRVWVNGVPIETYDPEPDNRELAYWPPQWAQTTDIRWASMNGHRYRLLWSKDEKSWSQSGYWVVPDQQLFVMGDWRDESSDSRAWGTVPLANVVGEVSCLWDGGARAGLTPIDQRTRCSIDDPVK